MSDKVRGMLLMGAYGDALGAPHELEGLEGRITDPGALGRLVRASAFYAPGTSGQPWGVWADADVVQTMRGVLTDDTSFRVMLLHPWLAHTNGDRTALTEAAFRLWLDQEKDQPTTIAYPAGLWHARQQQIAAWLRMYKAAENRQSEGFFAPDVPVVFGLFMYLDLAILYADREPVDVYTLFRDFCVMDQGAAGIYTGLLAGILAAGAGTHVSPEQFTDRFIETAQHLIHRALSKAPTEESQDLRTAEQALQDMIHFGRSQQTGDSLAFLKTFHARIYTDNDQLFHTSPPHLKNFHPHLFWMQIISTLAYAGDRPLEALRILSAGVGDTDTVASVLGSIMGAWMGYDQICQHLIGDAALKDELDTITRNLHTLYHVDLADRIALFMHKGKTKR